MLMMAVGLVTMIVSVFMSAVAGTVVIILSVIVLMVAVAGVVVIIPVMAAGVVFVLVHMRCFRSVEVPDALQRGQNQAIDYRSGRLEHAYNAIGMRIVTVAPLFEAVRARKTRAKAESGRLGYRRTRHGLQRPVPEPAGREPSAVERRVLRRGTDDPVAAITVSQRQRNCGSDTRIVGPTLGLLQPDVPGRHVRVIHRGQHELDGATRRTQHQVDAAGIPRHRLGKLRSGQQQQHDARRAERHQQHIHCRGQRRQAQVCDREAEPGHAGTCISNSPSRQPRTR